LIHFYKRLFEEARKLNVLAAVRGILA